MDKDKDFRQAQQKDLTKKTVDSSLHFNSVEAQVKQAEREVARINRMNEVTRYYIDTPLAHADDDVKASALKLEIQVAPGPTAYKDEDGNVIYRKGGSIILLEGQGVTTDKLWAEYIQREWPEFTVSELRPTGLASYYEEIQQAKEDLALQGA